jgi:tetratricopeptide (TPR) repeat protein
MWQAGTVGGSTAGGKWDLFVSYTQADRAWAEWIAWQLEEDGYRVLIQEWDMVPGANWIHLMQKGVQGATRTIAVLSAAYLESVFATAEWQAAWRDDPLGEQRKLLVFRVADCDRPGLLAGVVSVDLFGAGDAAVRRRVRSAVRSAVTGRAKPGAEPTFPPAAPDGRAAPRFPGTLPDVWNVPPRNPNFTGRAADLARIRSWLAEQPAVTVHALHGMGGVGKTQAAVEYAYRYADEYDLVWWINSERVTVIDDQFARLAEEIGLPQLADPEAMLGAVRRALRGRDRWLLIFDNAENPEHLRPLLPGGAGHVLITTRRSGFRSLGGVLDLDILDRPDAIALLRRRAPDLTEAQAEQLADRLGDLPLALDQAAAYLDQTGMPSHEYLQLLDTRGADLLSRGYTSGYPHTVATVWSVSLDRLQVADPVAVQLLELCAWLAPDPIPLDLFTGHCSLLPEPLASAAADPVAFNDSVGALTGYSLVRRAEGSMIVHRLVQDVTRHRSASQHTAEAGLPLETVLALLRADLPGDVWAIPESWPRCGALLPSVLAATGHASTPEEGTVAWLLTHAGTYLRSQGRYTEALPLHQRALHMHEAALGPDHPDVAADLSYVGSVLSDLGRSAEALPLQERALRIRETALGPDHPDVATHLNYVGRALADLGQLAEALPLQERALRIRETALGPDHPDVAADLDWVGGVLADLGQATEALPLLQRALRIRETALGPDHPDVVADLNRMGRVLSDLGRSAEALPLHQRALRIHEAALEPDHPDMAADLNWMGRALAAMGRSAEALPLHRRALRIHEAALGPDHPDVAADLSYVGWVLSDLGRSAEALPLHRRALCIDEDAFGPDHPYVAADLNSVGQVLSDLGRSAEALPLHQRALRIHEAALGPDHPSTRQSRGYVEGLEPTQ